LTPEQLYLGHLKLIDKIAAHAARRHHFSREETEDFVSIVRLKLLEEDYRIIRKFEGKSTFRTYLTMVILRQMLDHQNHLWGKWRPSAETERLGPAAVRLEMLVVREGLTFDEACECLRTNEHVELSREQLHDIASRLPHRNPPRRMQGEEELTERAVEGESPYERVLWREVAERRKEVRGILRKALASLPAEERLIVLMRCEMTVAQIAKALRLEQKPLYRRIEKILKTLRSQLEKEGVRKEEIAEILSAPERDFHG
ncbi:MAG TPA: sigma-70 family RNA polymerase sigma factor, partial [Thermoanaerobaculia bacterium]|nr:sigma-70 family RNA polymerase sigma factor [Thermoanaerobaculia bacterium]